MATNISNDDDDDEEEEEEIEAEVEDADARPHLNTNKTITWYLHTRGGDWTPYRLGGANHLFSWTLGTIVSAIPTTQHSIIPGDIYMSNIVKPSLFIIEYPDYPFLVPMIWTLRIRTLPRCDADQKSLEPKSTVSSWIGRKRSPMASALRRWLHNCEDLTCFWAIWTPIWKRRSETKWNKSYIYIYT